MADGASLIPPPLAERDARLIGHGYEPVALIGKRPVADEWQKRPSTIEALAAERAAHPEATNTGARTGPLSVIDIDIVDREHAASVRSLAFKVLGVTPLERVGSKGMALLYRNETPVPKITIAAKGSKGLTGFPDGEPGKIEILGTGQQLAIYGTHPDTGRPYAWPNAAMADITGSAGEPLGTPLSALPAVTPARLRDFAHQAQALLRELGYREVKVTGTGEEEPRAKSAAAGAPVSRDHLRKLLSHIDPGGPRDPWRDVVAAIQATPLLEEPDETDALEIAKDWSSGWNLWDVEAEAALEQIWRTMPPKDDGVGYGTLFKLACDAGYTGGPYAPPPSETFAHVDLASDPVVTDASGSEPDAPFLMTEGDLLAQPDPEELVAGFLMKGENVAIYGPKKTGKTFTGLDIALSLAAGLPVFGHLAVKHPGPVVYLSAEGRAGMKRRVMAWRQARGIAADQRLPFYYRPGVPHASGGDQERDRYIAGIKSMLGGRAPVLIVLDTLARSMKGLDENDSGDAGLYLELTEDIRAAFDCTFLTIAHSGKDGDRGMRGSSAFEAGLDAIWGATRDAASKVVTLEAKWLKDAEDLGPFHYRLAPVEIAGTEFKSAVLAPVSAAELARTSGAVHGRWNEDQQQKRRRVYEALREMGAFDRVTQGVPTQALAEYLAGEWPRNGDERAKLAWEGAVAKMVEHLDNNCRARDRGKRSLYDGYSDKIMPVTGGRLVRRWSVPPDEED